MTLTIRFKGGPGSGHHGHSGRPGKVGGSLPGVDFSSAELASLKAYLGHEHMTINGELRENQGRLGYITSKSARTHIRNIDSAINKAPVLTEPLSVYRGIDELDEVDLSGSTFRDYGFQSGSIDKDVASGFAVEAMVEFQLPKGYHGMLPMPGGNQEVLLPRTLGSNGTWTIVSNTRVNGKPYIILTPDQLTNFKGGPGSGHHGHAGRPGKVGGSVPGTLPATNILPSPNWRPPEERVWQDRREQPVKNRLSKLETGERGEELAMRAMEDVLGVPFSTLNEGKNNSPIDIAGDHHAIEVKAGHSTNGKSAQHWRATIDMRPTDQEKALFAKMTPDEKRAFNRWKHEQTIRRKNEMVVEMEGIAGADIKAATIGVILSPDGSAGDVFMVPGFHLRLGWNKYATDEYYIGTYEYEG